MNENGGTSERKDVSAVRLTKVGDVLNAGEELVPWSAVETAEQVKVP